MLSRNLSSVKLVVGLVGACFKKLEYAGRREGWAKGKRRSFLSPIRLGGSRLLICFGGIYLRHHRDGCVGISALALPAVVQCRWSILDHDRGSIHI